MSEQSTQERFKRGAADAGRFFPYIAHFVGFTEEDVAAIRETRFIIEKYIPTIVGHFYAQLLRFPATRRLFLKKDGSIDQDYLEMRMQHQVGFWRRTAAGNFDDDYARFVDYVGRAHTSHGADPKIYIPQRYVIGMVGFVQRGIADALITELRELDPDLERRAVKAWNSIMVVLLEMFSRPYVQEPESVTGTGQELLTVDDEQMTQVAIDTYERGLGIARSIEYSVVKVAEVDEIADGGRKIVDVDGISIGIFHHKGQWLAYHNSCLHRGGPVCTGELDGDTLTCPWHGYQYDVTTGQLLLDPSAYLNSYAIEVRDEGIYLTMPTYVRDTQPVNLNVRTKAPAEAIAAQAVQAVTEKPMLKENQFLIGDVQPGQIKRVEVDGTPVAVCNVDGTLYAVADTCTHAGGPLSEGRLEGMNIICPWHDSCFDVSTGAVTCRPARKPVQVYKIHVADGIGSVAG